MSHDHLENISRKENARIERDDAYLNKPAFKDKKSAVAKSMGRHRVKVAKGLKGVYPGSGADIMDRIRKSIKKN